MPTPIARMCSLRTLLVLATGLFIFVGPRNDGDAASVSETPTGVQAPVDPVRVAVPTVAADDAPRERRRRRPIRMHRELLDAARVVHHPPHGR